MRCIFNEPPYTEPYVRWCERTAASHCLLLDLKKKKTDAYALKGMISLYSPEEQAKILETYLSESEYSDWERKIYENTVNFPLDVMLYEEIGNSFKLDFDYESLERKYQIPHHVLGEKLYEYQTQDFQTVSEIFFPFLKEASLRNKK